MDRKRIVFLAVNASYAHSSLAAWTLRSMVDDRYWDWLTVESTLHEDPLDVLERVARFRPHALAATLYLFNRRWVTPILSRYRRLDPACRIVVGGPECLGDNRVLLAGDVADAAIRGEGERSFTEWLSHLDEPARWGDIPGLCGVIDGRYRDNGTAVPVDDLDAIPPFYARELHGFAKPFVQLETSRGCPNGCLFCTSAGSTLRFRSFERVRADLSAIRAAGVQEVRVVDRTFNARRDRTLRLLAVFRDEFPELRFHLEIDPALVPQSVADELARSPSGQLHLEAGIQSTHPEVYRRIGRRATVSRTLGGLRRLCAVPSLTIHADLIAGLPGETLTSLLRAIETLITDGPAEIQLERLKLLPGTPLAVDRSGGTLAAADDPPYEVLRTPQMTFEDLRAADRLARVLDWFYNAGAFRAILRESVRAGAGFLERFAAFLHERWREPVCPSLEVRFRLLDAFLSGQGSPRVSRLRYEWYRRGLSLRNGPSQATAWKGDVPDEACLVEGNAAAVFSQKWRVDLEAPYLFCFGAGARGERAVLAVFRLSGECTRPDR